MKMRYMPVYALIILGLLATAVPAQNTVSDLFGAINSGNPAEVKALLAQGADIEARNKNGLTPLMYALSSYPLDKKHQEMIKLLLAGGADANASDRDGRTPLMWASLQGNLGIAKALLANGARVNVKDRDEFPALSYAKGVSALDMVKLLRASGAEEAPAIGQSKLPPEFQLRAGVGDALAHPLSLAGASRGSKGGAQSKVGQSGQGGHRGGGARAGAAAGNPGVKGKSKYGKRAAKKSVEGKDYASVRGEERPAASPAARPAVRTAEAPAPTTAKAEFPVFPWPPPKASASATIHREMLAKKEGSTTCGEVADRLEHAFDTAGYGERSWYALPGGGFALASRLEHFNEDGTPKPEDERWLVKLEAPRAFVLRNIIKALFSAEEGHYRVIVFVVTPNEYSPSEESVSDKEALGWLEKGANKLPESLRKAEYTSDYVCQALIYEFEQKSRSEEAVFMDPSRLQGETHLQKAKILSALGG